MHMHHGLLSAKTAKYIYLQESKYTRETFFLYTDTLAGLITATIYDQILSLCRAMQFCTM